MLLSFTLYACSGQDVLWVLHGGACPCTSHNKSSATVVAALDHPSYNCGITVSVVINCQTDQDPNALMICVFLKYAVQVLVPHIHLQSGADDVCEGLLCA